MTDPVKPIPPARVAGMAGDPSYVPDFDPGRLTSHGAPPQVVPVLQRAGDVASPVMVEGITIRRAKDMTAAEARNAMARIVNDMLIWIHRFPHELHGEEAAVLQFFQQLAERRARRAQADQHGQPIEPDAIDQTTFRQRHDP